MKRGYDVFGKAYGVMLRQDVHDVASIDHQFMQEMILVDEESEVLLYTSIEKLPDHIQNHELYAFSKRFKGSSERETVRNILRFTAQLAREETHEKRIGVLI